MKVRNPHSGVYDYTLTEDTPTQITEASEQLRHAQQKWSQQSVAHRVEVIQQWIQSFSEHLEDITRKLSIDTARKKVAQIEVNSVLGLMHSWCQRAPQLMAEPPERASFTAPSVLVQQQSVPYPVVGVISPWNFPLLLAMIDTIPALLAGSAVLLKPSEVTPRFMDPLEKSITAIPELKAVLRLVRGGAIAGKAVVKSVDAVCFTGSVPTGLSIAAVAAERFIPAFLELGGKDPAIVLDDADLDQATDAILRSCVGATGQACQSLERVYVAEAIYPDFVKMITQKAEAVSLTTNPDRGQLGPLIFAGQAKKIQAQINEAEAKGANIETGGKVENINGGLWCRPTVLTGVTHNMQIMTEETFGPIIPIMSYSDKTEAVRLANDSIYGLSAAVFSCDQEHALSVARQIDAGAISINDGSLTNKVFDAEKHSFKLSGINGSRMGDAALLRFLRKKALLIQTAKPDDMSGFEEGQQE
ncbi:MAG: aldehyde dehydrogenase family protein [Bacteroidota bacterium]